MFSSIQQQLGAYKMAKPPVFQHRSSAQQLPPPLYSFTQHPQPVRTISMAPSIQMSFSPQRMNAALPVRFEASPRTPAASLATSPAPAISSAPFQMQSSTPIQTQRSYQIPPYAPPVSNRRIPQDRLPRSRSSTRKHHIFDDKIYNSGIRSLSRKLSPKSINTVSQPERVKFDSRLFNHSIGSNRFYNQTDEKAHPVENRKIRFPNTPREQSQKSRSNHSELNSSLESLNNSAIRQLDKAEAKEIQSRLVDAKVAVLNSPSNKTSKSKSKSKLPKTFKKLDAHDYNTLTVVDLDKPIRFFDSQNSHLGQRPAPKQHIYFNKDFNRQTASKPSSAATAESIEEMLHKLDTQSKVIALLVVVLVLSLVIYQIVR